MEIKDRLIAIRESRGYSKKTVSEMTKIPYSTYVKYESGERKDVSMQALCKLADFYGVTADYLLGREPKEEQPIDYEEVKKKITEIIERIENLPPEYQAFMIKIVHMLNGTQQDVSAELHPVVKKPEIQQTQKKDDSDEYIVQTTTVGKEMDRMEAEQARKIADARTKKNAV
ncbi:MAG: helix-turn-helix transcriptional regulator [Oscillospiraceae bacterium]|nr:helix-turn-helix transcriptional regulator [Oscillospiraceae bacterium]